MNSDLFFSVANDSDILFIEHWAEQVKINYVPTYEHLLECTNKIIIIKAIQANYRIDLVRQLAKHNYIVLADINEAGAAIDSYYMDLIRDCSELKSAPLIAAGENGVGLSVNLQTFFFQGLSDLNILKAQDVVNNTQTNKPYKFLFLNGAHRQHRQQLWELLEQHNVLDAGIKSYLGYTNFKNGENRIPVTTLDSQYECPWVDPVAALGSKEYNNFCSNFFKAGYIECYITPVQYIDTYFTVVTESIVEDTGRFASEKTYKPLLSGHPIIAVSTPGHLEYLRKLGFQTWSPWIDESYDLEPNIDKRIGMIANEIKRLCHSDLDQFNTATREIGLFNHHHYINYKATLFRQVQQQLKQFFDDATVRATEFFANKELLHV
jgi:hypothetical protein